MRLRNLIGLLLLLLALACRREPAPMMEESADLVLYLKIPSLAETKASPLGQVLAETTEETKITDLKIWVFNSEDGSLLGYIDPVRNNNSWNKDPLTAFENKYHIPLSAEVALARPNVDVYALANGPSIGLGNTLGQTTTRAQLEALLFQGNYFGISNSLPVQTSVPSTGLPFAGVGKNLSMEGSYPVMRVASVTVKRAVSKLRFVFSQLSDLVGPVMDFTIDELIIGGDVIANKEYLFTGDSYRIDGHLASEIHYYSDAGEVRLPSSSEIALNPSPREYAYEDGMSAQEYENKMLAGIQKGLLTDFGKCYLRESDQPITGTVKYHISDIPGEASFTLDAGGFVRNRSWLVYIFFLRDAMEFNVTWTPWAQGYDFYLTD